MKKFFGGLVLFLSFLVIWPGTPVDAADSKTIASGVYIGSLDVSGMTVDEAGQAVSSFVESQKNSEITLTVGEDKNLTIFGSDLGITWENTDVVNEAYALGHQGNIIQRYKALKDLEKSNHVFEIEYGFDDEALAAIIDRCSSSFDQEKVNYSLKKTDEGFVVTDGQTGYIVDKEASASVIKSFVQNELTPENTTITLSVKEDKPLGSAEDLAKVKDVLGTFTTSYKTSGAARSANVANGCSLINGTTVYPGEEFSVLDTITPFTEANGYFPAGSYLNGLVLVRCC